MTMAWSQLLAQFRRSAIGLVIHQANQNPGHSWGSQLLYIGMLYRTLRISSVWVPLVVFERLAAAWLDLLEAFLCWTDFCCPDSSFDKDQVKGITEKRAEASKESKTQSGDSARTESRDHQ